MTEPISSLAEPAPIPAALTFLLALACGIVVANLYYVQPLDGLISHDYAMPLAAAGVLVTVTQVGYAAGLVLMVPLGDVVENRGLIVAMLLALVVALSVAFVAPSAAIFLLASLAIGISSSAVQIIVPFAGHLAPDATRGRVVGNVVSGLLFGIMLSRPFASFAAHLLGTRSIFALGAVATLGIAAALYAWLPRRRPHGMPYLAVLRSLGPLLLHTEVLKRRGAYQAAMFGAFSLFWTTVPLLLEGRSFGFTQFGIGVFALAGAGGGVASPLAGRAADAGYSRLVTSAALVGGGLAFLIAIAGGSLHSWPLLVVAAILLDMGFAANLVTGQRAIFALGPEARNRLNGLFLALFFLGGAAGSLIAGYAFAVGGWPAACLVGICFPVLAGLYFLTDRTVEGDAD